ncbi:MAG TPA: S9 family peptidase [Gaiellaceae bacterium]|jgi:dipeptidyl aminopeptidase/acylaminoacyl peptidase
MATSAPYGSWASPITTALVASEGGVSFAYVDISEEGVYWTESRPEEEGRSALVFRPHGGEPVDVVPFEFNVRTRVHEYGGGAWFRHGRVVFCSSFDDSRLYRIDEPGAEPYPITPESPEPHALRYADGRVFADGKLIVCVREQHGEGEPVNELVVLPTDGSSEPRVIATGRDFYASPRPSPDGASLAWLAWDHPHMPFEGTDLCVAELAADGSISNGRRVAGSEQESIFQPEWNSDGLLYFVSDRTGWSNLYVERRGGVQALTREEAELGYPQWVFDLSRYAFLADGRIACIFTRAAIDSLELFDPQTGKLERLDLPYSSYSSPSLRSHGRRLVFPASTPTEPAAVIELDLDSGKQQVLRRSTEVELDERYISQAQAIEFPGADGLISHGFYYPPANPEYSGPNDELPPLVVVVHGGPTAHVTPSLDLEVQLLTSRGIAVVDLNYGGSTGYGREYRDRLRGRWGEVDVEDSAAAVRYLGERGDIDSGRVQITGGSAGGYTTLLAMAVREEFLSGVSYYGVADLVTFHEETHKFESHYDEYLVGPWPEAVDLYRERSPVTHADSISDPLLLLQGLDDKVVPPPQAEVIVDALKRRGIPYAYIAFAGEGHGFRKAENIKRAAEAHLSFLAQVSGFEPADEIGSIEIENLDSVAQ